VPRVSGVRDVRRDGPWLLLRLSGERVEVPPEVYLRQFRYTPADDLDALAELCKLGLIRHLSTTESYGDLPLSTDRQWRGVLASTAFGWRAAEKERREVRSRHHGFFPVHAAEVAYRVQLTQAVTNHLLAYLAGEPVTRAWRGVAGASHGDDDLAAWESFGRVTDAALRDFHVRVDVEVIGRKREADHLQVGEVFTTLYSVGILQLVNDLAGGETVRFCANERCGRPFVRQLDRSRFGGHRMIGTIYCSKDCARAQYQREKRRRDKAAKAGGTAG